MGGSQSAAAREPEDVFKGLFRVIAAGLGVWFFVGDDAYVGKDHVATPFPGTPATGTAVRACPAVLARARCRVWPPRGCRFG